MPKVTAKKAAPVAAKKRARTQRTRMGYMIYTVADNEITVVEVTRSAEVALELVDKTEGAKFLKFVLN